MDRSPPLFGVFNVRKPAGLSSRAVVNAVQRIVKPAKAGHAGTLDPLATGVLVVCVGPATKLIQYVQDRPKTYRATFRLGVSSETDDIEAELHEEDVDRPPELDDVRRVLPQFVGRIEQVPPAYSAVHVDGRRAYKLARQGVDVELEARPVDVYRIDLIRFAYPDLELEIECGGGTYIRSIGRDLGESLGCGAVMTALERSAVGPFRIDDAVAVEHLALESIQSPLTCVADMPRRECSDSEIESIAHGRAVPAPPSMEFEGSPIALVSTGQVGDVELLGLAEHLPPKAMLKPRQVFVRR